MIEWRSTNDCGDEDYDDDDVGVNNSTEMMVLLTATMVHDADSVLPCTHCATTISSVQGPRRAQCSHPTHMCFVFGSISLAHNAC